MKLPDFCASVAASLTVVGIAELCIAAEWVPIETLRTHGTFCIIVGVLFVLLGMWRSRMESKLP